MKAVVYYAKNDARFTEFPEPELDETSVKIQVKYCGLCGTDIHKFEGKGGSRPVIPPVVLGHEISGIVVETGSKVTRFKKGDRVTADPNWYCKSCFYCQKGQTHMCSQSKGVVKGFAEFICPPEENVYHLPDTLSLRDAALAEPLSCCLHGLDQLDVHIGETTAVIGLGSIGSIMTVLLARISFSKIIVLDNDETKRELSKELGADLFINPQKENVSEILYKNHILQIDKVMECVGLESTAKLSFNLAGKKSTVVLFGVGVQGSYAKLPLYESFQKELTVKTSYINPGTMQRAIQALDSGTLPLDKLISKEIPMKEIPKELKDKNHFRKGKVLAYL